MEVDMKNLGKQEIVILINGVRNGKKEKKTVYQKADGTLYVNYLSTKRQIEFINGQYQDDYQVRAITKITGDDLMRKWEHRLNER